MEVTHGWLDVGRPGYRTAVHLTLWLARQNPVWRALQTKIPVTFTFSFSFSFNEVDTTLTQIMGSQQLN